MSRIAVDVDGCLANFVRGASGVINKLWPGRVPPGWQPHDWDFSDVVTAAEWQDVWAQITATENFWLKLEPYPREVGDLARFFVASRDEDVWLVTSRVPTAGMTVAKQTDVWVTCCGLRPMHNYLGVVPCAEADEKCTIYKGMGIEYSVDDRAETVAACDALPGHRAYLLSRPWNQHMQVKHRISSLDEFFHEVSGGRISR